MICATGHNNVHNLIDKFRKGTPAKWNLLKYYSEGERKLAMLGWDRIQRQAM